VFLGVLAGCGSDKPGSNTARIAVIPKGTTHEFWKSVHAGAQQAAGALGVEVLWKGPPREDDREGQVRVVEDFIAKGVAGIVLAPLDADALTKVVREAAHERIPVVIIDSALNDTTPKSFVATDNHEGGAIAARRLAELVGSGGKVLVMRYAVGSASTEQREQGFLTALAKEHATIQVVSSDQYAGATVAEAYKTAENLLVRFPDVQGVFCPNESTTVGMLRALQDGRRAGRVFFVGFDTSPALVEALRAGELHGLVLQDPFKMGEIGVRTIVDVLRGKEVPPRIDTGVRLATGDNMESEEIRDLLAPAR
jgi:ribose transport system substrate-binding protein